jgi:hypothetical protein
MDLHPLRDVFRPAKRPDAIPAGEVRLRDPPVDGPLVQRTDEVTWRRRIAGLETLEPVCLERFDPPGVVLGTPDVERSIADALRDDPTAYRGV